ncbi:hypothetical protein [Planosporangium mesophilum]|uniref:Uncharacterized protein n=1 Tax=Planosporangium mesophilum TaxID=689768 RepID=A0A8J3TR67_9ACTN|nr:hypothetical protein [Planosporangium mesophilum]GII25830.1 hypothetical protein Pme01_54270 [Planosporangium mesophilum]
MLPLPYVNPEETRNLWRGFWRWFDGWTTMSFNPTLYHQRRR